MNKPNSPVIRFQLNPRLPIRPGRRSRFSSPPKQPTPMDINEPKTIMTAVEALTKQNWPEPLK